MTDLKIAETPLKRWAQAADTQFEIRPVHFPCFYAAMATAYMAKYDADREAFYHVAIKNHKNGALNEKAQFNQTIKEIMEAKKARAVEKGRPEPTWENELDFLRDPKGNPNIAWPMALFDCSPVTDGGAMILLVADEIARNFPIQPL